MNKNFYDVENEQLDFLGNDEIIIIKTIYQHQPVTRRKLLNVLCYDKNYLTNILNKLARYNMIIVWIDKDKPSCFGQNKLIKININECKRFKEL